MTNTPDPRSTPQWAALDRIWKAVPRESRAAVKEDFRLLSELIRDRSALPGTSEQAAPASPPAAKRDHTQENGYLNGLSPEARRLALRLLTREGFHVYAFLMDLIDSSRASNAEELFDAYIAERDVDEEDEAPLREIMEACLKGGTTE